MPNDAVSDGQVTIVTVTFNSLSVLPEMLDSVPDGIRVVVVGHIFKKVINFIN